MENKEVKTELLPCPFCGEYPIIRMIPSISATKRRFYIKCINADCLADIQTKTLKNRNDVIAAWNQRTPNMVSVNDVVKIFIEVWMDHIHMGMPAFNNHMEIFKQQLNKK